MFFKNIPPVCPNPSDTASGRYLLPTLWGSSTSNQWSPACSNSHTSFSLTQCGIDDFNTLGCCALKRKKQQWSRVPSWLFWTCTIVDPWVHSWKLLVPHFKRFNLNTTAAPRFFFNTWRSKEVSEATTFISQRLTKASKIHWRLQQHWCCRNTQALCHLPWRRLLMLRHRHLRMLQ